MHSLARFNAWVALHTCIRFGGLTFIALYIVYNVAEVIRREPFPREILPRNTPRLQTLVGPYESASMEQAPEENEETESEDWPALFPREKKDQPLESSSVLGNGQARAKARKKAADKFIHQFITSRGNEYFCEIDEDYLTDRFNLTGLNAEVQYYQYALDLVTDVFDLDCDEDMRDQIEKSARHLYGLVHARYITTIRGLAKMVCSPLSSSISTDSPARQIQEG